mgnify:CR=1 FL=1
MTNSSIEIFRFVADGYPCYINIPHGGINTRKDRTMEHHHSHEKTQTVLNRISRVTGHMESIKRMVEEGRDCSEILIQLSAVRAAINSLGRIILQDHIEHCIVDAVKTGDQEVLARLNHAVEKFLK